MGQQQLLIIVLVVFITGLATWTGVRLVASMNQANERDLVLHQINVLVGEAKKFAGAPKSMGGGEGSFIGFTPINKLTNTQRVRLYMTMGTDWILFEGFGSVEGWDGTTPVAVVAQYDMPLGTPGAFSTISNIN
jgi:hypothetical protein